MRRAWRALLATFLAASASITATATASAQPRTANDPGRSRQWALDRIGAPAAWTIATGDGVTIAIVDSGIDLDHPDLHDKVDATANCVGHDGAPGGCVDGDADDDAGHGTHVAGIAAASTDNGEGVAGVAPLARLLAVRVLTNRCPPGSDDTSADDCEAQGTESDVADGVRWAADHGADVINLSLGSITQSVVGPGEALADALEYAWSRDAIPVLVAGNDLLLPGSLVDVPAVVVSATDRDDRKASYSNGVGVARWAVAAPGGESDTSESCESAQPNGILSTFTQPQVTDGGAGYACIAGTSMAAPHVSGALAVLRSAGLGPRDAVDRLLATATDLGPEGPDATFGAGRIDLARAVEGLTPTGQPLRTGSGSGAGGDVTTTSADGATVTGATGGDGSVVVGPGGDEPPPSEVTVTVPPIAGPVGEAVDDAAGDQRGAAGDDDSTPALPLTIAVLAIVVVGAAHAWRYLAASNLARRTPSD